MKFKVVVVIVFIAFILGGCYTMFTHPKVSAGEYSRNVKFYDNCSSCHTNYELVDFGYYHLVVPRPQMPTMWYHLNSYYTPWWFDINVNIKDLPEPTRSNDDTKLRDYDGNRSIAPSNINTPSRNSGTTSSGTTQNSSVSNSSSGQEQNSRQSDSSTPKSRDNSGERKK